MSSSTARTSDGEVSSAGISPITGKAQASRVDCHWAPCFGLFHVGRRNSITRAAASAKVGKLRRRVAGSLFVIPLFCEGIPASDDGGAVVCRQGTRMGEADGRVWSQADVPALLVNYDSLDPRLGARGSDVKREVKAVAMPAGLADGLDHECAELAHISPFPHFSHAADGTQWHSMGQRDNSRGSIIRTSVITLPMIMIPYGTSWESVMAERAEL